ncbi:hypothetical protein [Streptomyces sp. NPDC056661]|uniref:hypothetical protein n=1 Tax=Streptomyces sp. NPDC056661 TaxID=3345898 RepID=UPI0036B4738B
MSNQTSGAGAARLEELLSTLPSKVAMALRRVAAQDDEVGQGEREALVRTAFEAVGYPEYSPSVPIPLASELTPAQRALVECFAHLPPQPLWAFAVPEQVWSLRRWLGLDPPGALEAPAPAWLDPDGAPLWRALHGHDADRREKLQRLPFAQRLEIFCELSLGAYRMGRGLLLSTLAKVEELATLGDEGGTVAARLADWLVSVADGEDWYPDGRPLPDTVRWGVFVALAQAGIPIKPAWDRLLPPPRGVPASLVERCVEAIPAERRAAAIVAAARGEHPHYIETALLALLSMVPDPRLVDVLRDITESGGGRPRRALQEDLHTLATDDERVAHAVKGFPFKEPALDLHLRAVDMPSTLSDLSDLQRRQFEGEDGDIDDLDFYTLYSVHDATGAQLYDMYLFCHSDGSVYRRGTTDEVAVFVQCGVADAEDEDLGNALDYALYTYRMGRART